MGVRHLHWVRHGPTHQTAFTGWRDVPADLSDTAALARLNDMLPAASVISSDLRRAVETANTLGGGRLRLDHDRDLREFDFGAWDGLHFDDVADRDPDLSRAFWERPGDVAPPDGESWNAVTDRVKARIDYHMARTDGDLIAVAHFGVILCHLACATGMSATDALGYKIDPLSVTSLSFENGIWQVLRINHTP